MPFAFVYKCTNCGFAHEVTVKGFSVGPLHNTFAEHQTLTQSFACGPCRLTLVLPRLIDVEAWEHWKASDPKISSQMARYPFIADLVTRIDDSLAHSAVSQVEVGSVICP